MQTYRVELTAEVSRSFRSIKAAQSVDLNVEKKAKHQLVVDANIPEQFNIGVIVGNSGSGKTTLARQIFERLIETPAFDRDECVLDQFDENMSYEECSKLLLSVGLGSVIRWVIPMRCLSNGEYHRAIVALEISRAKRGQIIVFDEWTSVVDRTVGQIMSKNLAKLARRDNLKIVLLTCHFDVLPWLEPDWVINCNEQRFEEKPSFKKKPCDSTFEWSIGRLGEYLASITI